MASEGVGVPMGKGKQVEKRLEYQPGIGVHG
jgi:hypothetical protein